jgi:hypothetical protein
MPAADDGCSAGGAGGFALRKHFRNNLLLHPWLFSGIFRYLKDLLHKNQTKF